MTIYTVKDALCRMPNRAYYTAYHAEQMARALNLNEATHYFTYHGVNRFTVSTDPIPAVN